MSKFTNVIRAFLTLVVAEVILNITQIVASIVYQNVLVVRYTGQGITDKTEILDRLAVELASRHYLTMLSMISISVLAIIYGIHYWIYYYEKKDWNPKRYLKTSQILFSALIIISIILATCSYCLFAFNDRNSFRKEFLSVQGLTFSFSMLVFWVEIILLPIAEETLFRGIIFKRLRKSVSIHTSVVIQALFCGIFQLNLKRGIYSFLLSIILGYLMVVKNSVLYCIRIRIYVIVITLIIWKWMLQIIPVGLATGIIFTIITILMISAIFHLLLKDKNEKQTDEE